MTVTSNAASRPECQCGIDENVGRPPVVPREEEPALIFRIEACRGCYVKEGVTERIVAADAPGADVAGQCVITQFVLGPEAGWAGAVRLIYLETQSVFRCKEKFWGAKVETE